MLIPSDDDVERVLDYIKSGSYQQEMKDVLGFDLSDYDALRTELEETKALLKANRDGWADSIAYRNAMLHNTNKRLRAEIKQLTQQRDEAVKLLAQWSRQHQSDVLNEAPPPILETEALLTRIKGETT